MKRFLLLVFLPLLFCASCKEASPSSSDEADQIMQIDSNVRNVATFSYNVVDDIISSSPVNLDSGSRALVDDVTVDGDLSGNAVFSGSISDIEQAGVISVNNYLSRNGFPTFKEGDLNVCFSITDTTIKGSISGNNISVDDLVIALDVNYDLYLDDTLWRGNMTGVIDISGTETEFVYDYDTPIFTSLTAIPVDADGNEMDGPLTDGGNVLVRLAVNSNAPVNWINSQWDSPLSNLEGGGSSGTFLNSGKGYWTHECEYSISKYQPSGAYLWKMSVQNAAMLESDSLTTSVQVNNSNANDSKPVISDIQLSNTTIDSGVGGNITLTVDVSSEVPVNWINLNFEGPDQNIEGGGSSASFTNLGNRKYQYTRTWSFSEWAVNGKYTFSNISVKSEADVTSDEYTPLEFTISNNPIADVPVIESIEVKYYESGQNPLDGIECNSGTLSASSSGDSLKLALVIIASSNAPINWINSSFEGPTQNLEGGGCSIESVEISDEKWRIIYTNMIDSPYYAPKGIYSWNSISVGNEGQKTSSSWTGSLDISLTD